MPSLPTPGADNGVWGEKLNEFLLVAHNNNGTIKDGAAVKSSTIESIVTLSQAGYDALTPNSNTLYVIV
jgi:hypothetical protein